VQVLCKAADVPPICTHSLRGLHATLSVSAGMSGEQVAASLGHSSFAITARYYADGGAIADRNTIEVSGTLLGEKTTVAELVRLAGALTLAERSELYAALDRLPAGPFFDSATIPQASERCFSRRQNSMGIPARDPLSPLPVESPT
jgi:hypothetical protein